MTYVRTSQGSDIPSARVTLLVRHLGPPFERRPSVLAQYQITPEPGMPPISVGKWVNSHEAMVKPYNGLIHGVRVVRDPMRPVVD